MRYRYVSLMILFLLSSYISDAISERDYDKKKRKMNEKSILT